MLELSYLNHLVQENEKILTFLIIFIGVSHQLWEISFFEYLIFFTIICFEAVMNIKALRSSSIFLSFWFIYKKYIEFHGKMIVLHCKQTTHLQKFSSQDNVSSLI